MLKDTEMKVFIDGVTHYFFQIANEVADVGTPYLVDKNSILNFDFTGLISISGGYKGCVYFTAPSALLNHLLLKIGEDDTSNESLIDLVGEVANTISGNARSELGANFIISVPIVTKGSIDALNTTTKNRSFVIPINWRNYKAAIVINIEEMISSVFH